MPTIAIVGSRRWNDFDAFCDVLPDLSRFDTIVSGGAPGVDSMAEMLALALVKRMIVHGVAVRPASFTAAAHARNQKIVDTLTGETDALLAFPGPRSTGTWDTVRRAIKAGLTESNGRLIIRVAPV